MLAFSHGSVNNVRMEGYVTTAEAARIIGCVASRVRQLMGEKKLVGERIGRDWLVSRASAEQYRDSVQGRGYPRGQTRPKKEESKSKPKAKKPRKPKPGSE